MTWVDTFFYRHVGPKGPKTPLLTIDNAGDRPPRYGNIKTLLREEIETGRRDILVPIPTTTKQIETGRALLR